MKNQKVVKYIKHSVLTLVVLIFIQNISYTQVHDGSFKIDGLTRKYSVFLPQNYQPNMPVVFNFHGFGGFIQWHMDYTLMNDIADTSGFIVVYPQGINYSWNIGSLNNPVYHDDVGFISALIDTLDAHYNIDMSRIYSSGFSMGAGMTNRLAGELTHRFAAVAPIAGNMIDIAYTWNPIRPIPVLDMHGTTDDVLNYNGGLSYWSVEDSYNFWIQNSNCALFPDTIFLPDLDTTDNSTVEKISWTDCSDNSSIIHYKIVNGGHNWPDADYSCNDCGNLNKDINANVEIWNFFKNYENPLVNIAWAKKSEVFPGYIDPQGDTIFAKAYITNPENHPVSIYAKIDGTIASFSDSLLLYDDGLHFDENPNDNIWGNMKILSGLEKDKYKVDIFTHDFGEGTIHKHHLSKIFTTIGPVTVEDYSISQQDPNAFDLSYSLKNNDLTTVLSELSTELWTADTNVTGISGEPYFGTIFYGQVSNLSSPVAINIQNNPSSIDFIVHIFSNNQLFWSDSITVTGIIGIEENETNLPNKNLIVQNYPNPFNRTTLIQCNLPESGKISLKIYNSSGQEIETLVDEHMPAGRFNVTFNAEDLQKGIYYCTLKTNKGIHTKKIIKLTDQ